METFSADIAKGIVDFLETLNPLYWFHRTKINSRPTKGVTEADYYFMGDRQQPPELRDYLTKLAPTIDGFKPTEICINKYEVGSGMPEHIDAAMYSHNMVIALSDHGDGITIAGEFYRDVPGKGWIMPISSPPHEVTPVKFKRYTLIYLYD